MTFARETRPRSGAVARCPETGPGMRPWRDSAPARARSRPGRARASTAAAIPNRQVRKEAGEIADSDCRVTRNVDPRSLSRPAGPRSPRSAARPAAGHVP